MNPRQLVGRTVILVMTDVESLKGTVAPESSRSCFVLERPVVLSPTPDGRGQAEAAVDGVVWVDAARPQWVQVV